MPEAHLRPCKTCNSIGLRCQENPLTKDATGVSGADFVLYVSAIQTLQCGETIGKTHSDLRIQSVKIDEFSTTKILREINFSNCKSSRLWIMIVMIFCNFWRANIYRKLKSLQNWKKITVFEIQDSLEKTWFHVKSEWQENFSISTVVPN